MGQRVPAPLPHFTKVNYFLLHTFFCLLQAHHPMPTAQRASTIVNGRHSWRTATACGRSPSVPTTWFINTSPTINVEQMGSQEKTFGAVLLESVSGVLGVSAANARALTGTNTSSVRGDHRLRRRSEAVTERRLSDGSASHEGRRWQVMPHFRPRVGELAKAKHPVNGGRQEPLISGKAW